MEEIRLPQHAVNRIERRRAARFARMLGSWRRFERAPSPSDRSCDPLRSSQVQRLLLFEARGRQDRDRDRLHRPPY